MGNYVYKTDPFDHQSQILRDSWRARAWAYFMEMGTGKSKVTIDNAAALYERGEIDAMLILGPKGAYRTWVHEIETHLPDRIKRKVVVWSSSKSQKQKRVLETLFDTDTSLHIFVVNIEALSSRSFSNDACVIADKFMLTHKVMIVADESTTIKNAAAHRTKSACKLSKNAAFRRILSGFPVTEAPMDLWGQALFLGDPEELLGHSSMYGFQGRYCVTKKMTMMAKHDGGKERSFRKIVSYRNLTKLTEIVQRWSSRVMKSECLDLPEQIYQRWEVDLTVEQRRAYNGMKDDARVMFEAGEVSVTMALSKLIRFRQILSGFLPLDELPENALTSALESTGEEVPGETANGLQSPEISGGLTGGGGKGRSSLLGTSRRIEEFPSNRIKAVEEILDLNAPGEPVLIWACWRYSIAALDKALRKKYGRDAVACYYGATPDAERPELVRRFQDPADPLRILIGNRAMAFGLTLTAAALNIYYENDFSLDVRAQSEARTHRIGQTRSVTYIDLAAPGTVDTKIIQALRSKLQIGKLLMGDPITEWI